jgi:hypothetical protein
MKNSLGLPLQGSSSFFLGCCLVGFSFSSRAGKSSDAGYLGLPKVKAGALADKPPLVPPVAGRLAARGAILKAAKPAKAAGNACGATYAVGTKVWIGY